jgi:hypothetical protein
MSWIRNTGNERDVSLQSFTNRRNMKRKRFFVFVFAG